MRVIAHSTVAYDAEEAVDLILENQGGLPAEPDTHALKLIRATSELGAMFEQAMVRANGKRLWTGWPAAIRMRHDVGARCYYCPAQHGIERTLWLFITLPLHDGHLFGGVYIKAGGAQSAIYVVPTVDTKPARWKVQATGAALTPAIVDDLFQAVFCDDAGATARIAPHYGFDLFATPWS